MYNQIAEKFIRLKGAIGMKSMGTKKALLLLDKSDTQKSLSLAEELCEEGYHSCVSARGIKKNNTRTMTVELRGSFKDDAALQMYLR